MLILIADDDPSIRYLLDALLVKLGHDVIEAVDGDDAWRLSQVHKCQLLILDWEMPGLSGLEVCEKVRSAQATKYVYVIMLTSRGGKVSYLEAMSAGADDFVTKPFDPDSLSARIHVAERILGLQREVRNLTALLPICSYCKQIRDENGDWIQLERYLSARADTQFSHGICKDCMARELAALKQ